jgi:hypothetical protein
MRHAANEGFLISSREVKNEILIPRFYDPRIDEELAGLAEDYTLRSIDEHVANAELRHDHGDYIPKIYYGTGPIPYVRTSDLANWEVKASPKHGVPVAVYEEYKNSQDVKPGDIFFVHEGTYLIGAVAMVTAYDGPVLYQHHLAKFRVLPNAPFGAYFFLAAIEAPTVERQIRSKQFSADIIDSVVGRLGQVVIPVPKNKQELKRIESQVKRAVLGRALCREQLSHGLRAVDEWLREDNTDDLETIVAWEPSEAYEGKTAFLGYRTEFVAFTHATEDVKNDILLPKYYDPTIDALAERYRSKCDLVTIGDLVVKNLIAMTTGDEIGRMSYGTGSIPFVRTSDLASWELKHEPKQGVSDAVLNYWKDSQGVEDGDILLIRDGTYLVGSSILLYPDDLPLLYCGGINKLRARQPKTLDSSLLFTLLNLPFVRRQMRNKQFTRDVIDTLGRRLSEVLLPIPKDHGIGEAISSHMGGLVGKRSAFRHELNLLVKTMYPKFG